MQAREAATVEAAADGERALTQAGNMLTSAAADCMRDGALTLGYAWLALIRSIRACECAVARPSHGL